MKRPKPPLAKMPPAMKRAINRFEKAVAALARTSALPYSEREIYDDLTRITKEYRLSRHRLDELILRYMEK